jgi:hypothetical protein
VSGRIVAGTVDRRSSLVRGLNGTGRPEPPGRR